MALSIRGWNPKILGLTSPERRTCINTPYRYSARVGYKSISTDPKEPSMHLPLPYLTGFYNKHEFCRQFWISEIIMWRTYFYLAQNDRNETCWNDKILGCGSSTFHYINFTAKMPFTSEERRSPNFGRCHYKTPKLCANHHKTYGWVHFGLRFDFGTQHPAMNSALWMDSIFTYITKSISNIAGVEMDSDSFDVFSIWLVGFPGCWA